MAVARQIARLAKHSAIYGVGDLIARFLGVLLLPLYTSYLTPSDYGKIEILVAASAVLLVVLRRGISDGFFRFYFDSPEAAHRMLVVRTTFWFTMTTATAALVAGLVFAEPLASLLRLSDEPDLVRAAAVGLWAQMNYTQLTVVFRAEERSVPFVIATLANVLITIAATVLLVVVFEQGPLGALIGAFAGTLCVYVVLLLHRREQLGLEFSRPLLREMNRFGAPLIPAALALWVIGFIDRWFIAVLKDQAEVGVYSVAVRLGSAVLFLIIVFRRAWPAFAYSIDDDREARQTYGYVLTYVVYLTSWVSLALGLLAPWLVRLLASDSSFYRAADAVALLAFGGVAYAGYTVIAIGAGRARRTQGNWVVAGAAAGLNIGLNVLLIPPYGMVGAAVATAVAYFALFLGMLAYAQWVYPVTYQWRRVVTAVVLAVGLTVLGAAIDIPLAAAIAIAVLYPVGLLPLGFYLPEELRRMLRLVPALR